MRIFGGGGGRRLYLIVWVFSFCTIGVLIPSCPDGWYLAFEKLNEDSNKVQKEKK